jgi:hypothetical protein
MRTQKLYWSQFNYVEFQLTAEQIESGHHQGACDDDCKAIQNETNLNLDRGNMILELAGYGAWDDDELNALDNSELELKLIWIACGDIQDDVESEYNKDLAA